MKIQWLLLTVFLFLFYSCGSKIQQQAESPEHPIQEQIVRPSGKFELHYSVDSYRFTDKITVFLTVESPKGMIQYDTLPDDGDKWGDFLVVKRIIRPDDTVLWTLVPEKTGSAVLTGLNWLPVADPDTLPIRFEDREFTIQSSLLNDSGFPEDLWQESPENDNSLLFWLLPSVFLSLGGAVVILLLIRRRKLRKCEDFPVDPPKQVLRRIAALEKESDFSNKEKREQYRILYHMMCLFLNGLSVQFRKGQPPTELIGDLEEPSSYNQWALRALYPILTEMEELFYNPSFAVPDETKLTKDIRTIEESFRFLIKEEGPEHV